MNNRPVIAMFMVTDLLLHGFNEFHLIFLFHGITECEAFVQGDFSRIHVMMYLIEGTVVQLIDFMKSINHAFGEGRVRISSVSWHSNVGR